MVIPCQENNHLTCIFYHGTLARMEIQTVTLTTYKCLRCDQTFTPRDQSGALPRRCGVCKSKYWNTPRRRDQISEQSRSGDQPSRRVRAKA